VEYREGIIHLLMRVRCAALVWLVVHELMRSSGETIYVERTHTTNRDIKNIREMVSVNWNRGRYVSGSQSDTRIMYLNTYKVPPCLGHRGNLYNQ